MAYRQHNGRGSSYLLTILLICLIIVCGAYWRLSVQFGDLEKDFDHLAIRKQSLESNSEFVSKQLEQREELFSKVKVQLQQCEAKIDHLQHEARVSQYRVKSSQVDRDNCTAQLQLCRSITPSPPQLAPVSVVQTQMQASSQNDSINDSSVNQLSHIHSPIVTSSSLSLSQNANEAPMKPSSALLNEVKSKSGELKSNLVDLDGNDLDHLKSSHNEKVNSDENDSENGDDSGADVAAPPAAGAADQAGQFDPSMDQ